MPSAIQRWEIRNSAYSILCYSHVVRTGTSFLDKIQLSVVIGISSLSTHVLSESCTLQKKTFPAAGASFPWGFIPILCIWETLLIGVAVSFKSFCKSWSNTQSRQPQFLKVWTKLRKFLSAVKFSFFIMFTKPIFHLHSLLEVYQLRNKLSWNQYDQNYTLGSNVNFNQEELLEGWDIKLCFPDIYSIEWPLSLTHLSVSHWQLKSSTDTDSWKLRFVNKSLSRSGMDFYNIVSLLAIRWEQTKSLELCGPQSPHQALSLVSHSIGV